MKTETAFPTAEGFRVRNGSRYYNRPLYSADHISDVLVGDRPAVAMNLAIHGGKMGNLHLALVTPTVEKWIHDFTDVTADYIHGSMRYELSDPLFPKVKLVLHIVPLPDGPGFVAKISGRNVPKDSRLIWFYGGASGYGQMVNAVWQESYYHFTPQDCVDNDFDLFDDHFRFEGRNARPLRREDHVPDPAPGRKTIHGGTTLAGQYKPCEAVGVAFGPARLFEQFGVYSIKTTNIPSVITFRSKPLDRSFEAYIVIGAGDQIPKLLPESENLFRDSLARYRQIAKKIDVQTPDPYLDRVIEAMNVAADAAWYAPCFNHGTRMWLCPYLGWEIYYGPEAIGYHDRVKTAIGAFCSRPFFNGSLRSHYNIENDGYNMNEQFVDQVYYHYLWTGDRELMKEIFPVLVRVLEWQRTKNDPDGDHLYTNTLNTWESDYHWYYGGACTQASAYTARMCELLVRIADDCGFDATPFRTEYDQIRRAMFESLWLKGDGHFAEYRDTIGRQQLHPEAEQASIYVPLQCDLADPFQACQMLRWVETHLQPITVRAGDAAGRLYWSSEWRPTPPNGYNHSSRDPALTVSLNTAIGCFRAGLAEQGYAILRGAALSCYINRCPGGISYKAIGAGFEGGVAETPTIRSEGIDLANTVSLLLRNVVEGLFGIRPDLPRNQITITPNLPTDWKHAAIKTDDVEIRYQQKKSMDHYEIRTTTPVETILHLTARRPSIRTLRLDGKKVPFEILPALDHARIAIKTNRPQATVHIEYGPELFKPVIFDPVPVQNGSVRVKTKAKILHNIDPQELLANISQADHEFSATLTGNPGHHTFFLQIQDADVTYWKPIHLEIKPPAQIINSKFHPNQKSVVCSVQDNASKKSKRVSPAIPNLADLSPGLNVLNRNGLEIPIRIWDLFSRVPVIKTRFHTRCVPIPIGDRFNLAVPEIFNQKYESPKPTDRHWIRSDGLSEWNAKARPDDSVFRGKIRNGKIVTAVGVPFLSPKTGPNAAFVSLWDNFPGRMEIPIGRAGRKLYLLFCSTTFPMQSHVPNARVTVRYADGTTQTLDLVNPTNFDDTLADFGNDHQAADNAAEILGDNTHADLADLILDPTKSVDRVEIEARANQIVFGLMGLTLLT